MNIYLHIAWSSGFYPPRALRVLGLLLADSALTVSGEGEDCLMHRPIFFTKMAINRERKVQKSLPTWEMNRHTEGYKQAVDRNWGHMAIIRFVGRKPRFRAPKKSSLLKGHHVLDMTGKSCANKKVPFSKIIISHLRNIGYFFGIKRIFGRT